MTLEEFLTREGVTVTDFAKQSGVSRATLGRIKRTGGADSRRIAKKIIDASGGKVTARDLFPLKAGESDS